MDRLNPGGRDYGGMNVLGIVRGAAYGVVGLAMLVMFAAVVWYGAAFLVEFVQGFFSMLGRVTSGWFESIQRENGPLVIGMVVIGLLGLIRLLKR